VPRLLCPCSLLLLPAHRNALDSNAIYKKDPDKFCVCFFTHGDFLMLPHVTQIAESNSMRR